MLGDLICNKDHIGLRSLPVRCLEASQLYQRKAINTSRTAMTLCTRIFKLHAPPAGSADLHAAPPRFQYH